ncbi:MAG: hypothetical protein F6K40_04650 [Okeania sp. SIO3I5]|uniref:GUN4 domain-containing protein n=1 Tax=Okeania sp. SIO3I5 TaxID=2607805 RepID=UPI0013BB1AA0|nr:GUN4 domain-containing protein [Okeania sp. SIO3I5]NEQ35625.1 hypothetical protein [Okeania sp. SIO3I5]
MASEFQKVLDEVRKRSDNYEDIEDVKGEIIDNLVDVYQTQPSLFTTHLKEGGFDIGNLSINQPLRVIISDFLSQSNGLNIDELYKIFSKLYKRNNGIKLLKEIRDTLEPAKNSTTNFSAKNTPLPDLSILSISAPPIEFPIDSKVPEKPEETTILEPNLDPEIYGKLEYFLQNQQWKEADLETMRLMIEIADSIEGYNYVQINRDLITWLNREEIKKIPDEALKIIDELWFKYSNGNFGFSVQTKIWRESKGRQGEFNFTIYQNKFAKSIGWYDGKNWIKKYDDFNFSSEAKPGHLPSLSFPNQKNNEIKWNLWKETFEHFLPRLFNCGLI